MGADGCKYHFCMEDKLIKPENIKEMRTYKANYISLIAVLLSVIISSCTKEELVNPPKVILTTDWTNRTEQADIPSSYVLVIDNQNIVCHDITNTLPRLDAGNYSLLIYNTTDKIKVNGTYASVASSGGIVDANPGYLFYSALNIDFENDKEKAINALMVQQTRLLNIELTITNGDIDNIVSIDALLSGIANGLDLKTGVYSGAGLNVVPVFTRKDNKLIASVQLLGCTDEPQVLTLNVVYKGGSHQQIVSDVSSFLSGFEKDKYKPLTLKGNAEMFTSIEVKTNITDWKLQDSITGDTEIQ